MNKNIPFHTLITKKSIKFHHSSFVKLFFKAHLNRFLKREEKLDISVTHDLIHCSKGSEVLYYIPGYHRNKRPLRNVASKFRSILKELSRNSKA